MRDTGTARPWQSSSPRLSLRERCSIGLERARRWEFWPAWLFYIPIVIWILLLGLRYRRPTAFTAANPALDNGGVVGERKHQALRPLLQNAPDLVADFILIERAEPISRVQQVLDFAARVGWPVVLKPDVGQRGRGVFIARDPVAAEAYLARFEAALIAQQYIGGDEYGVFIARHPGRSVVQILSIVHKTFPAVVGDGVQGLRELILRHPRARLSAALLLQRWSAQLDSVPDAGVSLPLVEIGSHCRGSLFLDAGPLASPALVATLTRLSDAVPGYDFGRIDLRVPGPAELQAGVGLKVLELNGVTAESAHIYHPDTPLTQGYGAMFRQWSLAFSIGDAHARRGAPLTSATQLLRLFREDLARGRRWF